MARTRQIIGLGWNKQVLFASVVALSFVLAYAALAVHPLAPLGVVALSWGVILGIRWPFLILFAFVSFTLARVSEFVPALGQASLGKILFAATAGLFVLSKMLARQAFFVSVPHNKWMVLLVIGAAASVLTSTDRGASFESLTSGFIKVVFLYFLIVNMIRTESQAVGFQVLIAVICTFLGGYALLAQVLGVDPVTGQALVEETRAGLQGALGDPNDLALVLLMGAPFLLVAALDTRTGYRALYGAMLLIVVGGILATQSRGGLLGLAAGFGLVVRRRVRSRIVLVALVLGFLAVMGYAAGIHDRRTAQAEKGELDESAQGRLLAWEVGIEMFAARPITGVGFDQFAPNALNSRMADDKEPHNSFIKLLTETGVLGFIPFVVLFWITAKWALRTARAVPEGETGSSAAMRRAAPAVFAAVGVSAFFLNHSWTWFIYILHAQTAVNMGIFEPKEMV